METLRDRNTNNDADDTKSNDDSDDDDDELDITDIIEEYGILREQGLNELVALFEDQIPEDITQKEQLKELIKAKLNEAKNVATQAKNSLLGLKPKELQNLYNSGNINEEIVMLVECFMILFDDNITDKIISKWEISTSKQRIQRWKTIKNTLIDPKLINNIFMFDIKQMTKKKRQSIFDIYMTHDKFKHEIFKQQSDAAALLVHWLISMV